MFEFVLAVAAIFLLFTPVLTYTTKLSKTTTSFSGFQAFFGSSDKGLALSIGGIITFILIVACALLAVLKSFANKKAKLILNLVLVILAIVAAVFFFMMTTHGFMFAYKATDYSTSADAYKIATLAGSFSLGIGAIIDAIIMIVIAFIAAIETFVGRD